MTSILSPTLLVLATALASGAAEASDDLLGRWELTAETRAAFPPECSGVAYVFAPGTITMESARLRVITSYTAQNQDGVFHVRQADLRHNGEPNCQGRPAEYVAERFLMDLEFEIVGDRLRAYMWRKSDGRYYELERAGNDR